MSACTSPRSTRDFTAYGLLDHRHTAEIEQALGAQVLFTPHLAPMVRGILATCYARPPTGDRHRRGARDPARRLTPEAPSCVVADALPSTKATTGSNSAHVTARVDPRTGWVWSLCAIDNLGKGAAGQAVQCANLALGPARGHRAALVGVYP